MDFLKSQVMVPEGNTQYFQVPGAGGNLVNPESYIQSDQT